MKKHFNKLRGYVGGFMLGMKTADEEMFSQKHLTSGSNIVEIKEVAGSLADALLKGEITQEVKDLRYRTYKILEVADKLSVAKVNGNIVITENAQPPTDIYTKEGENLILLQDIPNTIDDYESYMGFIEEHNEETFNMSNIKNYFNKQQFLKIERNFTPRFKIENFVKKITIKQFENKYILELYCSSYKDIIDNNQPLFLLNLKRVYESKNYKSDILDIKNLKFTTHIPRYNIHPNTSYELTINSINEIIKDEALGDYVVRYDIDIDKIEIPLTEKYFEENLDKKYKNKEKKNATVNIFNSQEKKYYCEVCNKNMNPIINEDGEKYESTEKYDWIITKQEYGKGMCVNCLENHLLSIENKK